jgi:hypothetical protein
MKQLMQKWEAKYGLATHFQIFEIFKKIGVCSIRNNSRFFKWLYYSYIDSSARRSEMSSSERKPD